MTSRRRDDLAYLLGLLLGASLIIGGGFVELREARYTGSNDFSEIWAGARALVDGVDPYDPARWRAYAPTVQGIVPLTVVYGYPGWTALMLMPLALLPLHVVSWLWTVGGMIAAAIACHALLRAYLPGLPAAHTLVALALVASQPAIVAFYDGQWAFLLVAVLAVSFLTRGVVSGVAAAAAALGKPQLFLLFVPAFLRRAMRVDPRAAVAAAGTLVLTLLVSVVALPHWLGVYVTQVLTARVPTEPRATALPTALYDVLGPFGLGAGVLVILAGVVAAFSFHPRGAASRPVWLAWSCAAAPYTWSYDQLVLLVPLVVAAGLLPRQRALALVVSGTVVLLLVATVLHGVFADARGSESLNGVVPATIAALVTVLLWPLRAARDGAGTAAQPRR